MTDIILCISIMFIVIAIILFSYNFYLIYLSYKKIKRFDEYITDEIDSGYSVSDAFIDRYKNTRDNLSKKLLKLKIFNSYSKKYIKYSNKKRLLTNMNYISDKIFIGLLCLFLFIFSSIIKGKTISIYVVISTFIIGFFLLDIYLYINSKRNKKRIDDDISEAIIMMNNAFKTGHSIVQAVKIVSTELDGPIGIQFKKIHDDIKYGLDIETAFRRFAERVDSNDANYISSALSVLNQTGGSIVSIFDSVEKNCVARKKLREELKSVSSQSRFVYHILIFIPPVLVILILLLNSSFFLPLFTTSIGLFTLFFLILIYILYIYIIHKIVYIEVRL